jgi:putative intracellular protease/amidase
MRPRRVVIMAFEGMQSLDAVGPLETFSGANRVPRPAARTDSPAYTVTLASLTGGEVRKESRMTEKIRVAIPLFPRFTALDGIGPYEVLQRKRVIEHASRRD